MSKQSTVFTLILPWDVVPCLRNVTGREKPHAGKYQDTANDWNCDTSCMLTSLLVLDFKNLGTLFLSQTGYKQKKCKQLVITVQRYTEI
jgi:hypothetical protein